MENISLGEIIKATSGTLLKGSAALYLPDICTDTRAIKKGNTFLALKGPNFNANDLLAEAVKKGAAGVICEKKPAPALLRKVRFAIVVKNSLAALQQIAGAYRGKFDIPVIAITGSNGKTTTKEMIGKILSRCFRTLVTPGNLNNQIGLPLTLLQLRQDHQAAVLELGTSALGEIDTLARIAKPTIGVITCIGHSHLQGLKNLSTVLRAKMELIDNLGPAGTAVMNNDDHWLRKKLPGITSQVVTFGVIHKSDVTAHRIASQPDKNKIIFTLGQKAQRRKVTLNILGKHNVYNALAAAGTGLALGIPLADIVKGLSSFHAVSGRMKMVKKKGITILDDSYNANPDSMKAALLTLESFSCNRRKIAVLGDMLELGQESGNKHWEIGEFIGQLGLDMLYTIGPQSQLLAQAALQSGLSLEKINRFSTGQEQLLVRSLKANMRRRDIMLFKASHGMCLEKIVASILDK
ncbi:MAG: UDP-N-acetylmuramoyl-tripeptide--D-alanyl-D-alanine ligase [bacterium]|nr:UDP-N-acetylmuramoyl-tripeptide--D-alanyl-D-alanine ligase [bacterium]MDD5354567.1 UDP-N-acetylmuramoyl-tripeptide--D-alanyl-D-alanine ligase [bacterium]MDD5755926.1 UDP-N-acetylmuramoyl-tripeptide--D-alanyl-D-alanine ligase [bacterium]